LFFCKTDFNLMIASLHFTGRLAALAAVVALAMPAMAQTPAAPVDPALKPTKSPAVADFRTCDKPVWPKESLRLEQTGNVTLRFLIGVDGTVKDALVLISSGHPLLDEASRSALEKCQFKPGMDDGVARQAWMQMQYAWSLKPAASAEEVAARLANLRKAAERGEADAQFKLGEHNLFSSGPDHAIAKGWLLKAADQGHGAALERLSTLAYMGWEGKPDAAAGAELLRKAAVQRHAQAQSSLGGFLLRGRNGVAKDVAEAKLWLRKAAEQGEPSGQAELGRLLWQEAGETGDVSEAIGWLDKAALKGERIAQLQLARANLAGRGVAQDFAKAAKLFQAAANSGDRAAHVELAALYENGKGVAQDLAKAEALRQRAKKLSF
jgi:TonB family protein